MSFGHGDPSSVRGPLCTAHLVPSLPAACEVLT